MLRLALDLAAAALLLFAFAYYWLDNKAHELAGTAMFILLFAHNTINRRWYGGLRKPQEARRNIDKMLVFSLLAAMSTLLITSVIISQTVFATVASPDAFTARRLHVLAAYWALILVAVHIGIRWRIVLGAVRHLPGLQPHRLQSLVMRMLAAGIAVGGIYSSFEMDVGAKLLSRMSLDGWDFTASTPAFFLHHIAIVGLYAFLGHYAFRFLRRS